jgi:enediyne polyketide synthase
MKKPLLNSQERANGIAIIGLGCYYPGASSPLQLWENILARRQQFRKMPDVRLPNSEYFDPDPSALNKTYQNKAAVIDGYEFNWIDKRIPKQTYESTDIVHWLALDTAMQAISDTKYNKDNIPREKTGVILGNSLTGEFTRSNQMLLRWPYVRKALKASVMKRGLGHIFDELEGTMETFYKSVFAPVTEDTLAGGLANTVAGRICNYLDLHGGGYIVDGACSSSLLAVVTAANYLESHQMDLVIAGGVDISLDTFELVGFAKTSALTPDEMRVYDKGGKGFLPGEGCGMVIMKRMEDAIKDNDQVYAIVKGWGISSDGKGGITAPSAIGQSRALIRAHEKANLDPVKLDFIEGHGTGTTVGDKVELEAIAIALNSKNEIPPRNCGVTSLKSIVGHTKAAAGIGAFIKTVIAVNRRVFPPTAGIKELNTIFEDKALSVYPIIHGQVRDPHSILTAGVSAMGFGGINSHVVLQSGDIPNQKLQPAVEERKLMVSNQSHELYLFSAGNKIALAEKLNLFLKEASGMSYAEMADLAYKQNTHTDFTHQFRAAIVAHTPFELERKVMALIDQIGNWNNEKQVILENHTIVLGYKKENPIIGVLFPGQGSQKINMAFKLTERHDWLKEMVNRADSVFKSDGSDDIIASIYKPVERAKNKQEITTWLNQLKQTNVAQPAITLVSLLWYKFLERLGITINYAAGHSLGELMAFYAAGLLNEETLLRFAAFRGRSMAEFGSGTMASLVCTRDQVEQYIKETSGYVTIANINAPQQIVISGETTAVRHIIDLAAKDSIGAIELPVSAAFHSNLVAEVAGAISKYDQLKNNKPKKTSVKLISSVNGKEVDDTVNLNTYFADQAVHQVDFISVVNKLQEHCNMLLEVGPGKVLSGLVSNISDKISAFPVEINAEDDLSLNVLLANIFVLGCDINTEELYKERLIKEFIPAYKKTFLINPLERPFPEQFSQAATEHSSGLHQLLGWDTTNSGFNNYLKNRGDFIKEMVDTDFRYFRKYNSAFQPDLPKVEKEVVSQSVAQTTIAPLSTDRLSVRDILNEKIESMTGFNAATFKSDMKLLDDFNLDSIKSGSLLAGLARALHITGKINTSELSNASLGVIVERMNALLEKQPQAVDLQATGMDNAGNDIPQTVYQMLSERTGFPVTTIKPDFKLLDDLNLDSIKAGSFIAELSKRYNIQGKIGASKFANARIDDVIQAVSDLTADKGLSDANAVKVADNPDWVNAYSVKLIGVPLDPDVTLISGYWKNKSLVIVHDDKDSEAVQEISKLLKTHITKIIAIKRGDLHLMHSLENSCLLVMLPGDPINYQNLTRVVNMLSEVAGNMGDVSVVGFLQRNNGYFSRKPEMEGSYDPDFSAISFAASLHHEKPDLKIRVIEVDKRSSANLIAEVFLKEFVTNEPFMAAAYDLNLTRCKMVYEPATSMKSLHENTALINADDVLLATGGAKGITAECVYSFAQKYKCKIALIGSSPENEEIRNTLARYRNEHITSYYYTCDIGDSAQVKELLNKVQNDLGKISVVIHGAGRNVPRRAEQVTAQAAMDEIAPKVAGAIHILEELKDNHLKYFVALTSIIGVTGMPGNSWYAFSNETLDLFLRSQGARNGFRVRTLAYSIWDEVGMGARMGSNKVLAGMGIGSISPALGIEQFLHWTEHESSDQQVVISSKMGGLDTWNLMSPKLPEARRYIMDITHFEPGRELTAMVKLNRATDLYIDDHNYNGSLLFPTVFGIEAMAQAACLLAGAEKLNSIVLENISLLRPIVVPDKGDIEVEIKAHVAAGTINSDQPVRIFTGISTEYQNSGFFNFSSDIVFGTKTGMITKTVNLPAEPLKISPESDLYTWLLFQGPRFRHIKKVFNLNSTSVDFTADPIGVNPAELCFADSCRSPFLLGSPLFRDILLQSVQLFLTSKKYLPVKIKRWEIFDVSRQVNGGMISSKLIELNDTEGVCDVEFISDGRLVERIEGYTVKALDSTPGYPKPEKLAALPSLFDEALEHELGKYRNLMVQKIHYRLYKNDRDFNKMDVTSRHSIEEAVLQQAIADLKLNTTGEENHIIWAANGKPAISNSDLKISITHSRSVLLMTVGSNAQGCDLEFVENRTNSEWSELLDGKYDHVLEQLRSIDNDVNLSATRLWCLKEALIKSQGMMPLNIGIEKVHDQGVVFRVKAAEQSDCMVLTFPVPILPNNTMVISNLIDLREVPVIPEQETVKESAISTDFDLSMGGFTHSFLTTFKDCKRFFGKTHFTNYPGWMGSLRELVLEPISQQILSDLGSGQFGMVTNESEIRVFNEADTLNQITGNLWITNKSDLENSFIDLSFEYLKKEPETGALVRLASCSLSTTWVKIEGRGIVKKSPIPDYFMEFLNKYRLQSSPTARLEKDKHYPGIKDLGNTIYENPSKIRPELLLMEKVFQTGMSNSNTVGNLYYSNYYDWQSMLMEQYLYQISPNMMLSGGRNGEFITLESTVRHLQEAMPFEDILVSFYVDKIFENGVRFSFEYFSQSAAEKRKLAYGYNTVIWCKRKDEKHIPIVQAIPEELINFVRHVITV